MRTIERNYRKHPHTAAFLQTFHTAGSAMDDNAAEYELAASEASEDLLNLVPERAADLRTPGQASFMADLIERITRLDPATGRQAKDYTDGMTERGLWTPGRGGNASTWIDRMIAKENALKAARPQVAPIAAPAPAIPAGIYAIETDEIKCYRVDYGREGTMWSGQLFLTRISSDDRYAIRDPKVKAAILDAIAVDVETAGILAAHTIRECRKCGRTLTDTKNPHFGRGYGPDCGSRV